MSASHRNRIAPGNRRAAPPTALRMTQPECMKTTAYVRGVQQLDGYDAWELFKACAVGDVRQVRALLGKDQRLVNAQCGYQFPIHFAVRQGSGEIVQILLDHGADPGQSIFTYDSWPKLLLAARQRGYRDVERTLERALKAAFHYSPQFDELKDAIIERDVRRLDDLLRRRPNLVRAADALGNNALHWCVITRQLNLIARFAESGAPVDVPRADGQTPILLAVNGATDYWHRETRGRSHPSLRNHWVLVGALLAHGADYSISVAAAAGDQNRVAELLDADPELAKRLDSARGSPLSHAARERHTHIVRLLLGHGADPNMPEEGAPNGRALYEACVANDVKTAELLLEHGANPNAGLDSCECCLTIGRIYHGARAQPLEALLRRKGAFTPPYRLTVRQLKQAIRTTHEVTRHDEFLTTLLRTRNAGLLDLYLASEPSALHRLRDWDDATYPNTPGRMQRLLVRGLDPNQSDWLGRTLLHVCAANGDRAVAAVLLDAGADVDARELEFNGTPLATAVRIEPPGAEPDRSEFERRRRAMVEYLLRRGARPNLPDDESWATPLAWARRRGLSEIETILKAQGATDRTR